MKKFRTTLFLFISALIIITLGSGLAISLQRATKKLPITQFYSPAYRNAIWDWSNPINQNTASVNETANLLASHQINTVYIDVSIFQTINNISDKNERTKQLDTLSDSLENYIKIMHQNKIAVYASGGDTDWSKVSQQFIPKNILSYIEQFNSTREQHFDGIEFDIESYNQEGFAEASMTEKSLVLMEFLDTASMLTNQVKEYISSSNDKSFEIGFSIPYWFDNENKNIETVSWRGKTGPTLYHLMDLLNELPQSNVIVMAYRNAAQGNDGIIYHSRTEVEYAQSKAQKVKVILGIETTNVEPAKITFYKKSQNEISSEVALVTAEYERSGVFGGIAINDLPGYTAIIDSAK